MLIHSKYRQKLKCLNNLTSVSTRLKKIIFLLPLLMAIFSQPTLAYVYSCTEGDDSCVINYNKHAIKEGAAIQKYNLVRIVMPGKETRSMGSIKSSARWLTRFFKTASRGQLRLKRNKAITKEVAVGTCKQAKKEANSVNDPSVLFTIRVFPKGLCHSSNAGKGNANLVGTLKRDFAHEVGHLLGLKHGNALNQATGKVQGYKDPSTFMGRYGSSNYSIPQLHWLGWTKKSDVVQLNAAVLNNGGSLDVKLRPVDSNKSSDSDIPLAYVYDLPGNNRLFISIPRSVESSVNGIKGGQIFFYVSPKCKKCRGMAMGDNVISRIGNPKNSQDHEVRGLIITPISFESQTVRVKGRSVDKFSSVTLRISKSPEAQVAESRDTPISVSPVVTEPVSPVMTTDPIIDNLLPRQKPRFGRFTVGFKGKDKKKGDAMANAAARFYNFNSRGKLHVVYTGAGRGNYVFKVDTTKHHSNMGGLSSYQHDVATHELGHKLGLGHSKWMTDIVKAGSLKGKLRPDRSTVMNYRASGAPYLVAPQYYLKGWLPKEEVALFDGEQTVFELKRINDFSAQGLSTVVITSAMWNIENPGVGAPVFISFGYDRDNKTGKQFAMHLSSGKNGTGTSLIAQRGDFFVDNVRTGIRVDMLDNADPDKITVSISLGHK